MAGFDELVGSFDPDPKVRGERQFEPLVKWFLKTDPEYSRLLKRVWLWRDWPGRDGPDVGIDLVAEAVDGGVWAIQAKCTREDLKVAKREADSFLAASGKAPFTHRLLVTSASEVGRNLLRTLLGQYVEASVVLRDRLVDASVRWPASLDELDTGGPLAPKDPRPHQLEAVDAVEKGLATTGRGQLVMACGTGKTLTSLFVAERLDARRTLVLVPSLSLLAQSLSDWTANDRRGLTPLAVCSDETVANTDHAVARTSELGIPVTTDPAVIARFLRGRTGPRVVFATYQSSPRVADAQQLARVPGFDLVVADEAHRCAGAVSSDFATVLDDTRIRARRRLFMTATPRYFTGRVVRAAGDKDWEVASMDDETRFGPVLHRLAFSQAIERDLLSDYQVAVVVIDDPTYRAWAKDRQLVTRDGRTMTDAGALAAQIGLTKAMCTYDLHRVITFHSWVASAKRFAAELPDVAAWTPARQRPTGTLWCEHIAGTMPAGHRRVLLNQLRDLAPDSRGVISNARCLSEGIDVPALDGVAFIDPRSSTVDIIQAVGRAIRKAPDKTIGTIIVPVYVDHLDNPDTALDQSAFKPVWDVINALRDHDDDLAEQLDHLRRQLVHGHTTIKLPDKIHLDLPTRITKAFAKAFDVRLVQRTTSSFEAGFARLEAYALAHGHARPLAAYCEPDGFRLGSWADSRRQQYRRGQLPAERIARLEGLPGWTWTPAQSDYERGFEALLAYVAEHSTSRVPKGHRCDDGLRLDVWVRTRRGEYARGRLSEDRARQLEELPGWVWRAQDAAFAEGLAALWAFARREGHARVPASHKEGADGFRLGTWVDECRSGYRRGTLAPERVVSLEEVPGWVWDPLDHDWDRYLAAARDFVEREGHGLIPSAHCTDDGLALGQWVANRRSAWRAGRLSQARVEQLEAISGWTWEPREDRFERGLQSLLEWVEETGSANPPQTHVAPDGFPLGTWVSNCRSLRRRGQLSQRRQARLEQLPGWTWHSAHSAFESGLEALARFVSENGHARVPQTHIEPDGFRLGVWVNKQRTAARSGRLSRVRRDALEAVPGWVWEPRGDPFGDGLTALHAFLEREGHLRVPQSHVEPDGFPLGTWVNNRRRDHRKEHLDPGQVQVLEALPGWVWDQRAADFRDGLERVRRYAQSWGTPNVPVGFVDSDGFPLGRWVGKRRAQHRARTLDADRIEALEQLPGWSWEPHGTRFARGLKALRAFAAREGHAQVPSDHAEPDGFRLGVWVENRRADHRHGRLDRARTAALDAVPGWSWDPHRSRFENGLEHLRHFVEAEKHAQVPAKYLCGDGFRLGSWCSTRRAEHRAGKLSLDRVEQLEAVPGWTWRHEAQPIRE